ncbi:MAG TPA: ATP-dependent DNA helicase RecG [Fibrobacteres bacterium]|nr:ATP-dependent DNA helicase RecG [Fibrobacterota bacterium]
MEISELLKLLTHGEDSRHQFKRKYTNDQSIAEELVAFANTKGGLLIFGIEDNSTVTGLLPEEILAINKHLSNVFSQHVHPAINPDLENIDVSGKVVMILTVAEGISKPYMDKNGVIWVKSGADKRKATSREEIQRMYQSAGLIHGDEIPANGMTIADIDLPYFEVFFQKEYGETLDTQENSLQIILENMNLAKTSNLNIAGALLFAKQAHFRLPTFIVKAVAYPGTDIDEVNYLDSRDITGKISDVFQQVLSFIKMNIRHSQANKTINSTGEMVVPEIVFEELVANALIHRDYFISAPIRIFLFENRIEIISPGHLPNNLTVQNIKSGNSNIRNPILASFATKLLPYRGLGNGIRRAIKAYPSIDFFDDRENNLFKVVVNL